MRHTFAKRCIEAGVSLKTVQTWLGHTSIEMTANTYSHIQREFEKTETEKINILYP
ncbi:MAG: tyrosine-type recombinase/integrase [Clostridia bacterium]|nr:tyrosine-type recombinase/integrase [Clostridia bacterium]